MTSRAAAFLSFLVITGSSYATAAETGALSEVFTRVNPSVVEIYTRETALPKLPAASMRPPMAISSAMKRCGPAMPTTYQRFTVAGSRRARSRSRRAATRPLSSP